MPGGFDDIGFGAGSCGTADGYDYWDHPTERHREHQRHVRNLLVMCALVAAIGIAVHPGFFGLAAVLLPLLFLESWAARTNRSTSSTDQVPSPTSR